MGNAPGAETEFWTLDRIRKAFPEGITDLPLHEEVPGPSPMIPG